MKTKETAGTVESKKRRARELILQQRRMPLGQQYTMVSAIKHAKAVALVAIEALRLGQ
jgi:hypothetical protein